MIRIDRILLYLGFWPLRYSPMGSAFLSRFSVTSYLGQRLITPLVVFMWWREMAGEVEIGTRMRDHATSYYPWPRVRIMVTKQKK